MHTFDVTAVINGHTEGLMALSSLRSLARNADTARLAGLKIELIAVLDKPDPLTLEIFESFANMRTDIRVEVVDMGDLGFARNKAAALASGKWISFLDADDIWADRWLVEAFTAAENDPRQVVWHPAVNVYFGARAHLFLHGDMDDPQFDISTLSYTNLWTALAFVSAEFLRQTPYARTDLKRNIGYEDWSWNIEVVNQGAIHKVVPGIAHAIRTKSVSLLSQTIAAGCIAHPTHFFRHVLDRRAGIASKKPDTNHPLS